MADDATFWSGRRLEIGDLHLQELLLFFAKNLGMYVLTYDGFRPNQRGVSSIAIFGSPSESGGCVALANLSFCLGKELLSWQAILLLQWSVTSSSSFCPLPTI